jgi:motility quorum-sensing regulator/GCU-specific mRNA interferase toxin
MEKRKAHCPLTAVKALIQTGKVKATFSALAGAAALGLEFRQMVEIVMELTPNDFYKSMTTHADPQIWQDVYRPRTAAGPVYLKLTVVEDVLIVSFKEL